MGGIIVRLVSVVQRACTRSFGSCHRGWDDLRGCHSGKVRDSGLQNDLHGKSQCVEKW